MNANLFGYQFRALRLRSGMRQSDLADRAGVSSSAISKIERGLIDETTVRLLDRACSALGATLDVRLRWRGEQLDRLLDELHAALVETTVALLRRRGWTVAVEVSFSIWGERGSIDVFAHHPETETVLVVEVKSTVPDSQATIHGLDRKARLGARLAGERGWQCRTVARLLVVGASRTSRRRIEQLAETYAATFPVRGRQVRDWLRKPSDPIAGLLFVSNATGSGVNRRPIRHERVRRMASRSGLPGRLDNATPGGV